MWKEKVRCLGAVSRILNLNSLQSVWNLISGRLFKYFLNQSPKEECKAYGKDIKSYVRVLLIFLSPGTWPCGIWFFNQMVSIWWSNCALKLKFVFLELSHTNTELCGAEECFGFWKWENHHPVWAYGSRSIERLTVELPSLLCKEVVECFVDSFYLTPNGNVLCVICVGTVRDAHNIDKRLPSAGIPINSKQCHHYWPGLLLYSYCITWDWGQQKHWHSCHDQKLKFTRRIPQ